MRFVKDGWFTSVGSLLSELERFAGGAAVATESGRIVQIQSGLVGEVNSAAFSKGATLICGDPCWVACWLCRFSVSSFFLCRRPKSKESVKLSSISLIEGILLEFQYLLLFHFTGFTLVFKAPLCQKCFKSVPCHIIILRSDHKIIDIPDNQHVIKWIA